MAARPARKISRGPDRFEANAVELVSAFSDQPGAEVVTTADVAFGATGIPTPAMNIVARSALHPSGADARIAEVIGWFRRRAVPFSWWVFPTSTPRDLVVRLTRAGLVEAPPVPAMALDVGSWVAPAPQGRITIERVLAGPAWHATAGVMAEGFDLPDALVPVLEDRFGALLGDPDLRWFAARLDGEIVACALGVLGAGVVGIYNVATLPASRGHGAGTAVTAAVLADGQRAGARLAVLESSPQGHGVYRRLGFEDVGVVRILVGRAA
jgi:GNAT superfamily N-acetyltransferase